MLQLLVEDTFSISDIEFELNLFLPLYQYESELVTEDWTIDPKLLMAPKGSDNEYARKARQIIIDILDDNALPELHKIIKFMNDKYDRNYTLQSIRHGDVGIKQGQVSVSYYIEIGCNTANINCSNKLHNSLSSFKIRIANHISNQEKASFISRNNVKLFSEQVIGLYESLFIRYTNNIFTTYSQFLDNLSNYDSYIDTFNDIKTSDIDFIKSIAVQGEFPNFKGGFV